MSLSQLDPRSASASVRADSARVRPKRKTSAVGAEYTKRNRHDLWRFSLAKLG